LYPGLSFPAAPGETIALYATGLGQTNPAISDGNIVSASSTCVNPPSATVGGAPAQVVYCGLIEFSAGLYQVNVVVPGSTPTGNAAVTVTMGAFTSPNGATIAVQ
jgi:uncharacterized protein (TIGR03437 family)